MVGSLIILFQAAIAATFAALAFWQAQRSLELPQHKWICAAFTLTAIWALASMASGFNSPAALIVEAPRNLAWLGFVFSLSGKGVRSTEDRTVGLIYVAVSLVVTLCWTIAILRFAGAIDQNAIAAISTSHLLTMIAAIGALVLTHHRHLSIDPAERNSLILPLSALSVLWLTELNDRGISYLSGGMPVEMDLVRAVVIFALAPLFGIAMMRNPDWRFSVSRRVAVQSASIFMVGAYLFAMIAVSWGITLIGGQTARIIQVGFVVGTATAGLMLLPSQAFRAWLKVKVAKHFYAHRYDYREEWMRFTNTIGRHEDDADPFGVRVIKAMAGFADSPGGALLVPDGVGGLIEKAVWNWNGGEIPIHAAGRDFVSALQSSGRIVDFRNEESISSPYWMSQNQQLWVAIPLLHNAMLAGVVLLEKPVIERALDWEDLDLFRVAGRQAASYLAEESSQVALSDARQFEEFNRRFAFMMHDIKNVVSQLSLVSRNAEKHADNPEFRKDMAATLKSSSDKMSLMLQRLSQHGQMAGEPIRPMVVLDLVDSVARDFRGRHPVIVMRDAEPVIMADPHRLEQALAHLVQNGADASDPAEPVTIAVREGNGSAMIDVIDKGSGMSPAFIANQLFKPFASSKANGFGIGAYEARELIQAMGGELSVQSAIGVGTHFTISLPQALGIAIGEQQA